MKNTPLRTPFRLFLLAISLFGLHSSAFALDPVYTGIFSNKALDGYDTVAYFQQGKPVKGNKKHSVEYKGAVWYFASAENADLFRADPTKYSPQYGAYCAWRMAQDGEGVYGDPEYWEIYKGKLYVNYDNDIQQKWVKDKDGFIAEANRYWREEHGFSH